MRNTTHKSYLGLSLIVAGIFSAQTQDIQANEVQVDASVTFTQALSIVAEELSFGDFTFSPTASANEITISAADDSVSCTNTADYGCPAKGTAGVIDIAGSAGNLINIACEANGAVSNGNDVFGISNVKIFAGSTETSCAGLSIPTASIALSDLAQDNSLRLGAKLSIPASGVKTAGTYSTSNSGGQAVAVKVLYQ